MVATKIIHSKGFSAEGWKVGGYSMSMTMPQSYYIYLFILSRRCEEGRCVYILFRFNLSNVGTFLILPLNPPLFWSNAVPKS